MSLFEMAGRVIPNAPQGSVRVKMSATPNRRVRDHAPCLSILRFIPAFVLALISPRVLRAETTVNLPSLPGSGVTVRLATPLTQMPHFGFLPVRVYVENLTPRDGTWELNFQVGGNHAFASGILNSTHTVAVPAGQTRETWLYVPIAQAGFVINSGSPGGTAPGTPRVTVTKIPGGTKITRAMLAPGARPTVMASIVVEIDETTGEMTTRNFTSSGAVVSTNTSRPPPGNDVTYTIDANGNVSPRYRLSAKAGTTSVTVSSAGALAASRPKITIAPTATGMKVTRVSNFGINTTQETDFDTTTGAVTTTRTRPDGSTSSTVSQSPSAPGAETTYTIDPVNGTYARRTRTTSAAVPKIIVVVGGAGGASGAPASATAPPGNAVPMSVAVEISGPGFAGAGRAALPNNSGGNTMRPFAVSVPLEAALRSALASEVRGAPNLAGVTVAQLPADWRVWSAFAGVVLAADEFSMIDAGRRSALLGWVGLGGQLYLVPAATAEARTEAIGAGLIVTLGSTLADLGGPALRESLKIYSETPALPDREALFLKNTALGEEIKTGGADSSWVAIFLVVFAAVIGPVNLFVFAPREKRHRLFWTTPALSLLGGLVLVAAIFLQDGVGGAGRRSTLVVFLPGQKQAAVFQEQAARTGFLFKRTFALDDDVILAPLALEAETNAYWSDVSSATRANGQAGGEWFPSRSRPAHLLRRLAPTRGRVELVGTAADGAPIVESSLATVLRGFVLCDDTGKFWLAEKISPGTRVTLMATKPDTAAILPSLGGSRGLTLAYQAAIGGRGGWSASGGETEVAPLATLSALRWSETTVVYAGILERPAISPLKGAGL